MSKEIDKIIEALETISIKFDELGFSPTIPIPKGNKAHFADWFKVEIDTIKVVANKQAQRIAELEEQLKTLQEKEKFFSREFAIEQLEKVKARFNGKRPIDEMANDIGVELGYTATQIQNYIANLQDQLKKSLESNNDLLKQIMELEAQLIKERLKGENK